MDKQTSLRAVNDMVACNSHIDWGRAHMDIRVYSRQACPSDEDPRPRYIDVGYAKVMVPDLMRMSVEDLISSSGCKAHEDVVIGNVVWLKTAMGYDRFWYPQMDFMVKQLTADSWQEMMGNVEPTYCPLALNFYDSGRSYHGHGVHLMDMKEWTCWLGVMLRLNNETMKQEPVVDARWIGKALMDGQSFLRVTANSSHYIKVPTSIDLDEHRDGDVSVFAAASNPAF